MWGGVTSISSECYNNGTSLIDFITNISFSCPAYASKYLANTVYRLSLILAIHKLYIERRVTIFSIHTRLQYFENLSKDLFKSKIF